VNHLRLIFGSTKWRVVCSFSEAVEGAGLDAVVIHQSSKIALYIVFLLGIVGYNVLGII
jgi:hypothetical protein